MPTEMGISRSEIFRGGKKRKRTENELEHKVGRKWQVEHLLILQDKFWTIQDLFFGTYLVLSGGIENKRFEPLVIK